MLRGQIKGQPYTLYIKPIKLSPSEPSPATGKGLALKPGETLIVGPKGELGVWRTIGGHRIFIPAEHLGRGEAQAPQSQVGAPATPSPEEGPEAEMEMWRQKALGLARSHWERRIIKNGRSSVDIDNSWKFRRRLHKLANRLIEAGIPAAYTATLEPDKGKVTFWLKFGRNWVEFMDKVGGIDDKLREAIYALTHSRIPYPEWKRVDMKLLEVSEWLWYVVKMTLKHDTPAEWHMQLLEEVGRRFDEFVESNEALAHAIAEHRERQSR
jgi:hypothetical protein